MYARVTRWEGADGAGMRKLADQINQSPSPPEGVPAKGVLMLMDAEGGQGMVIALFETEADRSQGDETLNAMSPPPGEGMGQRVSVEMYEVGADMRI